MIIHYENRTVWGYWDEVGVFFFGCGQQDMNKPNGITYCSVCPDYWSTDVGNNSGNSGALLLNRQGDVVGVDVAIVTQSDDARTLGFAIPSNTAVKIAAQLIAYGQEGVK